MESLENAPFFVGSLWKSPWKVWRIQILPVESRFTNSNNCMAKMRLLQKFFLCFSCGAFGFFNGFFNLSEQRKKMTLPLAILANLIYNESICKRFDRK